MDEPASALDPIATQRIEELIYELKTTYTIVIVTHNMQQAARVSDYTAFFWLGRLVEYGPDRQDLHQPDREADRGLHHRAIRLVAKARDAKDTIERPRIFRRSSRSSRRGCSRWAAWPRNACARPSNGLVDARPRRSSTRCCAGDEPINQLHIEIDDRCFKLLALHQPMAIDLRAIVAAVKINTDLERVGDLAVNIAEAAAALPRSPAGQAADRHSADGATSRRRCCATRWTRSSGATRDLAQHVLNSDDELDALKTQVFRELLTYMLQDPDTIEPALDLILVSRHLERIGDHATNVAEDVIFMVSAPSDVRHHTRAARYEPTSRRLSKLYNRMIDAPTRRCACMPRAAGGPRAGGPSAASVASWSIWAAGCRAAIACPARGAVRRPTTRARRRGLQTARRPDRQIRPLWPTR